MSGRIIVLTGDGKGKTTAAFGMALRAAGHGKRVVIIQFLKKGDFGDIIRCLENVDIFSFGDDNFVFEISEKDDIFAKKAFECAEKALLEHPFLLVLDEINVALHFDLITIDEVNSLLTQRGETNIVLTGRNAPKEIVEKADLVTEMRKIKHHYDKGAKALDGIEY